MKGDKKGNKKPFYKKVWFWVVIALFLISLGKLPNQPLENTPVAGTGNSTVQTDNLADSSSFESIESTPIREPYEYDELQKIFIEINADTTMEEIDSMILENNLFYTSQKYNKSGGGKQINYVIAYTEGSAVQKYADPGDYLKVTFDESANNRLMYAYYVNSLSVGYSALFYNYGTYFELLEEQPGPYTGYYINDSFGGNQGITITYSNGNSKNTNYFLCESGEETVNAVIDKIREK